MAETSPPFFRLRSSAGNIWPALPKALSARCWLAYRALDRCQWLPPQELEERQLAQLRLLLTHCKLHIPHYARVLGENDIDPPAIRSLEDFRKVPLLDRNDFRQGFADFRATVLPPGTVETGKVSTSGSTGIPVTVLQTNEVNLWWLAHAMRDFEWCGLNPRGKLAAIRYLWSSGDRGKRFVDGFTTPYWIRTLNQVVETGPSHTMDVHQDPRKQMGWLREVDPDYLLSYPSNLEFLAGLVRESGGPLGKLRCIQAISETLTDETRQRVEEAFGVPVKNTYSCNEAGYIASPCPQGHGLHVHSENVLLELLDENDRPCSPGESGTVVLTTLRNFITPLVRYRIQDRATLASSGCPCGRGLPLLSHLQGKERPLFHLSGGRRKNSNRLALTLRKVGGFHQFRIHQREIGRIVVRLVPDREWSGEHEAKYREKAEEFFEGPVTVDFEKVERLELTRSGKSVDVVCEIEG